MFNKGPYRSVQLSYALLCENLAERHGHPIVMRVKAGEFAKAIRGELDKESLAVDTKEDSL